MEELSKLRDELYEALPTGKIDAIELMQVIKKHISKLDELIELKKLRVADVIKNEVAVCELKGIGFCQHEDKDGKCNFEGNCINKQTVL